MDDHDEVRHFLEQIVADLHDPEPRSRLGDILAKSGDEDTAVQLYLDAGELMFERGLVLKSLAFVRTVGNLFPGRPELQTLHEKLVRRAEAARVGAGETEGERGLGLDRGL